MSNNVTNNNKEIKKISIDELLKETKPKTQRGETISIYKIPLGNTHKEQKKYRTKLRNQRDEHIENFIQNPVKENWDAWLKFAETWYKDIKIFFSPNSREENVDRFNNFIVLAKQKGFWK